jgi:hypothetical protein
MAPHRLATAPAVAIATKHGAIAIIASSALSIWPQAVLHDPIAKAHHQSCKSRGLSYVEALKRVARRMSDLVYALLKSGKAYDRSIIEHAIKQRREQAAHAARSRAKQSLVHSRPRKSNSPLSQQQVM